jgi:hypothetical protein
VRRASMRVKLSLTLPLSQTHSFALTGAGASVSPTGRDKGEATRTPQLTIGQHYLAPICCWTRLANFS